LNDTNKINHIFQSKHKLDPLINILWGKNNFINTVINKANWKFPTSWIFNHTNPIILKIEWYTLYIQWSMVNGIPRIGTIYIP
jgi:hypothetical protein